MYIQTKQPTPIFWLVKRWFLVTSNINDQDSGWSVLLRRYVLKGTLSTLKLVKRWLMEVIFLLFLGQKPSGKN